MPESSIFKVQNDEDLGPYWIRGDRPLLCTCIDSTNHALAEMPGCEHSRMLAHQTPAGAAPEISLEEISKLIEQPRLNRPLLSLLLVQPEAIAPDIWARLAKRKCLPTMVTLWRTEAWENPEVRLEIAKSADHIKLVKALLQGGGAPARAAWAKLREYGEKGREVKLGIINGVAPVWLDQNILAGMLLDEEKEFRLAAIKFVGSLSKPLPDQKTGILNTSQTRS